MNENYSLLKTNLLYTALTIVFLTIGGYFQNKDFYSGIFITEYIIILLPVFLLAIFTKVNIRKALKINPIKLKTLFKIFIMAFLLLPVIASANLLIISILSFFGKVIMPPIPEVTNGKEFLVQLFFVSISAGLCEEFFFRGMVLNAYEGFFNKKWGVISAALLFGLFHFNIQNLLGPIILGLVFGYIVQLTNSIFASVIAHIANNGIAVTIAFIGSYFASALPDNANSAAALNTPSIVIAQFIFFTIIASISAFGVYLIIKSIAKDYIPLKVSDNININETNYSVMEIEENTAYIKNKETEELKKINIPKLLKSKYSRTLKIWDDKIENKPKLIYFIPIGISVIMYFMVLNLQLTMK
ncbi:type II CAAX endopeptidase family protein [Helicovermis profundi]|uniref:Type II CAAX endopeptidase family protein n=1 Tax=Helicovermis profundi TaxID=3065157 RepID=A0AAU9EDZ3_9FIRM|nr:type II CAAX endopeptidase family protein [Clostridia bacterium S502]